MLPGVAINPFLAHHRDRGHSEGPGTRLQQMLGMQDAPHRVIGDTGRDTDQREPQCHSCGSFDTTVTVGVIFVRLTVSLLGREEHEHVGHEIRKRVNAIRDQGLRLSEPPDNDLEHPEHQVQGGTDESDFANQSVPLGPRGHIVGSAAGGRVDEPTVHPGSRCSPSMSIATVSRSRTTCASSPSTRISAARGREL